MTWIEVDCIDCGGRGWILIMSACPECRGKGCDSCSDGAVPEQLQCRRCNGLGCYEEWEEEPHAG